MGHANWGSGIGFLSIMRALGLLQPASSGKGDLDDQKLNSWSPIFWPLFEGGEGGPTTTCGPYFDDLRAIRAVQLCSTLLHTSNSILGSLE